MKTIGKNSSNKNRRVVLVTNIPTPYRLPLFEELHDQLAAKGTSFQVVFAALGYPRRKWRVDMSRCRFRWKSMESGLVPARDPEGAAFTYSGLGRILREERGALFVVAGFSAATARLWLGSLLQRANYLIWSGAILLNGQRDGWARRWYRRLLVSRARGFIAYGTLAREYLISLGARPEAVRVGINTVDTHFFRSSSAERKRRAPGACAEFIYVGELSPRKRVDLLLRAVAQLQQARSDFMLRLVGSGTEEANLRSMATALGISDRVEFLGFRQREEVARCLAIAECFLFPTSFDIWGLVLVEAMAAGLVCLSSIRAGATRDLIRNGETGLQVDFEKTDDVVRCLAWVLDHPAEAREIGLTAQRCIHERATIRTSAGGFVDAIEAALA